jgi:hypothetical protein
MHPKSNIYFRDLEDYKIECVIECINTRKHQFYQGHNRTVGGRA